MDIKNLAYIAGVAEDAHLRLDPERGYEVDMEIKSIRWARIVKELVAEFCKVKTTKRRGYIRIRTWNKPFVEQLYKIKNNPEKLLKMPRAAKIAWIRGFADAEGSVTINGSKQPMLSLYNKNLRKLQIVETILKENGLRVHYYNPDGRDVWQQYMTGRKNLRIFLNKIGLSHPDKLKKLIAVTRSSKH